MKDIITSMNVRVIEPNKYSIVLTHENGDKTGSIVSEARALDIIDEIRIL